MRRRAIIVALLLTLTGMMRADDLTTVLERVGSAVEQFSMQLSAVACTELLTRTKLGDKGKAIAQSKLTYDYLILTQFSGEDVSIDESRIETGKPAKSTSVSLLTDSGFSVLSLIFHPLYQSSFEFRDAGETMLNGLHAQRIEFHHVAGHRTPSILLIKDREYPVSWQGVAWLRRGSLEIMRIDARLAAPMPELGLLELEASVSYSPVSFTAENTPYWLPSTAVVQAGTARQHWRNIHQFSAYRRFNVETTVKAGGGS